MSADSNNPPLTWPCTAQACSQNLVGLGNLEESDLCRCTWTKYPLLLKANPLAAVPLCKYPPRRWIRAKTSTMPQLASRRPISVLDAAWHKGWKCSHQPLGSTHNSPCFSTYVVQSGPPCQDLDIPSLSKHCSRDRAVGTFVLLTTAGPNHT